MPGQPAGVSRPAGACLSRRQEAANQLGAAAEAAFPAGPVCVTFKTARLWMDLAAFCQSLPAAAIAFLMAASAAFASSWRFLHLAMFLPARRRCFWAWRTSSCLTCGWTRGGGPWRWQDRSSVICLAAEALVSDSQTRPGMASWREAATYPTPFAQYPVPPARPLSSQSHRPAPPPLPHPGSVQPKTISGIHGRAGTRDSGALHSATDLSMLAVVRAADPATHAAD